jgi:chromodomain-helicase-DNA-binding protein 1
MKLCSPWRRILLHIHRDPPGVSSSSSSERWESAEFRVKWRRSSYTHCTWEPLAVLRNLPGFKRITNYCK